VGITNKNKQQCFLGIVMLIKVSSKKLIVRSSVNGQLQAPAALPLPIRNKAEWQLPEFMWTRY
jgi:hypothetical protein